jgi:Cu-Zn family superoxide dismutase
MVGVISPGFAIYNQSSAQEARMSGKLGLLVLGATFAFVTTPQAQQPAAMKAHADIKGDGITGTAEFREIPAHTAGATDPKFMTGMHAVEITVNVTGLKPGAHGIHLHAVGKCEAPGFTTAGGHFDPGPAGNVDPDANHPFHMGDLPNIVADAKGHATLKVTTTRVTLSDGPLSLFDADGTAIIIHANPDQGVTAESKAGLSGGPRAACGVIVK